MLYPNADKTRIEGSVKIVKETPDKRAKQLTVRRENVWNVLSTRVGKIIQVTFGTGDSRKMRTDEFLIASVDKTHVWLDEVVWNDVKMALEPKGKIFTLELEKVHFILDGDQGIWPASGKRK